MTRATWTQVILRKSYGGSDDVRVIFLAGDRPAAAIEMSVDTARTLAHDLANVCVKAEDLAA